MSGLYSYGQTALLAAEIDLVVDDIRALLVRTGGDIYSGGPQYVSQIVDFREFDGANYVRKSLAGKSVTRDASNTRGEFHADDLTYTALGAGTTPIEALILYKFVTNDADSPLIGIIDTPFPYTPSGSDVLLAWNAEGVLYTE